jgi:hypothetical protein
LTITAEVKKYKQLSAVEWGDIVKCCGWPI